MTMLWVLAALLDFNHVENWIAAGGYVAVFALLFACGLGLPMPEDIPLIIAGALVANGKLNIVHTSIVAWCGIIGGDLCLYHFGKKFGLEITRVPFIGKHVTKQRIQRAEELFEKYGIWVVAIGRMFAGIRGAMVVAAGAIKFNRVKFIIADGLAAIVSGGLFLALGYWLGANMDKLLHYIHEGKMALTIMALVVVLGVVLWTIFRKKKTDVHGTPALRPPPPGNR
jgi:membrane protein DedA with SNARE-associated domain